MFSQDELTALIKRVGLDLANLQERNRFLEWQEADAARLKQAAPLLDSALTPYFSKLAQHLTQFSDNPNLALCDSSLQNLTQKKQTYYQKMWDGERDEDFIRNRVGIGMMHHKIGLEPHQYLGSFRIFLEQMLEQICGQNQQT
ncbi:MAG: protoglobin domain-containing protein, partial [Thiopseudomonas sp.]|nr:protoglobin domain-containing protein [Thiopseudomonas sp.]